MTKRWEKAKQAAEVARLERIATIFRLSEQGNTLQVIADQFGLTRQRVQQIVAREQKRAREA